MIFQAETSGRVDKLLAGMLPHYSRAALARLFDEYLVLVDSKVAKPGFKVRSGARIEADLSPLQQQPQVVDLPILYEDENVVVIDKPAGIISHARGRYWYEPSVASFIRQYALSTKEQASQMSDRSGIVHRLDRATSGVMICSKNETTTSFLQRQFSDRSVAKVYVAVLEDTPKLKEALIDAPIERNPKKPSTFRVGERGRAAQTYYKVLRVIDKKQATTARCLVQFEPRTGRTHQLRVHAQYIRCPIVGDDLYGKSAQRLYLHASSITIRIPEVGQRMFTSPVPEGFYELV